MTTLPTLTWEKNLLSLAQEADVPAALARTRPATDAARLAEAYEYCAELTAIHSRSFSLATRLLPAEKRRAMRTLYAFCRVSDDIVDRPGPDAGQRLEEWKLKIFSVQPDDEDLVALAWADTRLVMPSSSSKELAATWSRIDIRPSMTWQPTLMAWLRPWD